MKTFHCDCGNTLYFANSQCLKCHRAVGFLPDEMQLSALQPADGDWLALYNNRVYRQCKNNTDYQVCNWMVSNNDPQNFCVSCRLNHVIPNLSAPHNLTLWYRIEQAKRRLLYTLFSLNLPVLNRVEDPLRGMGFQFLQDETTYDEFSNELTVKQSVATGHNAGIITINILEAEHRSREDMREKMNERYRTLLGHFRHESGHYYWDRLISETRHLNAFRALFGDERVDYQEALNSYYHAGPLWDWQTSWISAYASSHPWEDWAETWAHYLHMVDCLETANDFGFRIHGRAVAAPHSVNHMANGYLPPAMFEELFADWCRLSAALNALNRSMGLDDAYPFIVSGMASSKLRFVHQIVTEFSQSAPNRC